MTKKETIIEPDAYTLVEATRSIGYSFETAISDIIDNSIGNFASRVDILFETVGDMYVEIIDNGIGMNYDELIRAMKYGSKSVHDKRDENDLGRFGLGLKMASLSQCKSLTVISKKDGIVNGMKWDIDHIKTRGTWSVIVLEDNMIRKIPNIDYLDDTESGTIVLWENFDRLESATSDLKKTIEEKMLLSKNHIALVFHRLMDKTKIYMNNDEIIPRDPFLVNNTATQKGEIRSKFIDEEVIYVKSYVLPHISKLKKKDKELLGGIDDFRNNQGLYIYRNKRLIIWGKWFGLAKRNELNKLVRIMVDIPSSLDHIWDIDIKKSRATVPPILKKYLKSVIDISIPKSERVYTHRERKINDDGVIHVWDLETEGNQWRYKINRKNPLLTDLYDSLPEEKQSDFRAYIELIERSIPYDDLYSRMSRNCMNANEKFKDIDLINMGVSIINIYLKQDLSKEEVFERLQKHEHIKGNEKVISKLREILYD